MKHIRYKFQIDDDVKKEHRIGNIRSIQIGLDIREYLSDPTGWKKYGYFFEDVLERESVLIRLSSPATIRKICGDGNLSCAELGGRNMYLNSKRWFEGSKKSGLNLLDYRQYMVTHEIGHILGHGHKQCPCKGCPAPLMLQQTLGLKGCRPNTNI